MDADLKQYLDEMQAELLRAFSERIDARHQELHEAFLKHFEEGQSDLRQAVLDAETRLLTAFHAYAKGQGVRLKVLEIEDQALKVRMDALEERVLALETGRGPANPAAA